MTWADFHSIGKVPGWSEKLNKFVKDSDIAGAASRSIRADIPSGPWAFVTFKRAISRPHADLEQSRLEKIWSVKGWRSSRNFSIIPGLSVKTDEKKLFNSCALSKLFEAFWFIPKLWEAKTINNRVAEEIADNVRLQWSYKVPVNIG